MIMSGEGVKFVKSLKKIKSPNSVAPMIAVVVLVAATILVSVVVQFTAHVDYVMEANLDRAVIKLNHEINHIKDYANLVSRFLAQDDDIMSAIKMGDRQALITHMEYLKEFLDIEVYIITDADGIVMLNWASLDSYGFDVSGMPSISAVLSGENVLSLERGGGLSMQIVSGQGVYCNYCDCGQILGVIFIGFNLSTEEFVDGLSLISGAEFMLFMDNSPVISSVEAEGGGRVLAEALPQVAMVAESGEDIIGRFNLLDQQIIGIYTPLATAYGRIIGVMLVWEFLHERQGVITSFIFAGILITLVVLAISVVVIVHGTRRVDIVLRERSRQIEYRDYLFHTINNMTARFLRSDAASFEADLQKSMKLMGEAWDVDRVFVFKNHMKDGRLHCLQIYEWSENAPPQLDNEELNLAYDDFVPGLVDIFMEDNCLNGIVSQMHPGIRTILEPQGIISVLLVPVFIRGEFWGFVGLDDCTKKRDFTSVEEMAMRSASLAIVSSLIHYQQILKIRRHEELEQQLIDANNAKSKFLAHMSHEIRTPLNGITGFTDLALELSPSAEMRRYLDNIEENSALLLSIVNDILDISKVEAGKMKLNILPFRLSEVLNSAYQTLETNAAKHGLQYTLIANEEVLEKRIQGDSMRLLQVLLNLLSNAVKFTGKGSVNLKVECLADEHGTTTLHFEVKDTGIGMTAEQLERVIKPFEQADDSITRVFGGTGLGLPICKEILKLMGSEMRIESSPGEGTKIDFTLSCPSAEQNAPESLSVKRPKPMFDAEVLLCEDNEMNRQVMTEHLNHVGIKAVAAQNGKEGIDIIQQRIEANQKMFDLIFMDINMPVMGGVEAAKIIKKLVDIPIVAVTANVMTTDHELYSSAGMTKNLGKPFRSYELHECLLSFLSPVSYSEENHIPSEDEKSKETLRRLFIKGNKTAAVKINNAIAVGNIKEACRIAHSLKSNAALMGKNKLQKIAAELEQNFKNNEVNTEAIKILEHELELALDEFGELVADTAVVGSDEVDAGKIIELLNAVEPLLKARDAKCVDILDELRKIKALHELADKIENFDFADALDVLGALKASL